MGDRAGEQGILSALGQLDGPLQAAGQRRARQIGAAHVGRAEARLALEQPGFRMQARAAAVERHAHLAARQSRQFIECARLGGAGVGGGEDAQSRGSLTLRAGGRDLLQDVLQLAHAGDRDEADQDVDLIGRGQLAPDLLQQRRRTLAGREQPRCRKPDLGGSRKLPIATYGTQHTQGRRNEIDHLCRAALGICSVAGRQAAPKLYQQTVDQFELPLGPVGPVAGDVIQDRAHLAGDGIHQQFGHPTVERPHFCAALLEGCEGSGQAISEQQVVETVRERHGVSLLQSLGRAAESTAELACAALRDW